MKIKSKVNHMNIFHMKIFQITVAPIKKCSSHLGFLWWPISITTAIMNYVKGGPGVITTTQLFNFGQLHHYYDLVMHAKQ